MGIYLNPKASSYREIASGKVFIDKSLLIGELNTRLCDNGKFLCVTMPSRFGKTYLASMVSAYYSSGDDSDGIFAQLKASKTPDYQKHLNKHNVIRLDIASLCAPSSVKDAEPIILKKIGKELTASFPEIALEKDEGFAELLASIYEKDDTRFILVIDEWDYLLRAYPDEPEVFDHYINFLRSLSYMSWQRNT